MMPANYNIDLYQGDNYNLNFTIEGNYSSYTHRMDIASTLEAQNPDISLHTNEIVVTYSAVTNLTTISVTISHTHTTQLDAEVIYYYDYQCHQGSTYLTFLKGTVSVYPQVTT